MSRADVKKLDNELKRLIELLGKLPLEATESRSQIMKMIEDGSARLAARTDIDEATKVKVKTAIDEMLEMLIEQKGDNERATLALEKGKLDIIGLTLGGK